MTPAIYKLVQITRSLHHSLRPSPTRNGYLGFVLVITLSLFISAHYIIHSTQPAIELVNPLVPSQRVTSFGLDQAPTFKITTKADPNTAYAESAKTIRVIDYLGQPVKVTPKVTPLKEPEKILLSLPLSVEHNQPGKYTLITSLGAGKEIQQDFTWGVLAMNFEQSTYRVGDNARVLMAVLDDRGKTMCNADISLDIQDPRGRHEYKSRESQSITVSKICADKYVTNEPDYFSSFTPKLTGVYTLTVTATIPNGTRSLSQTLEVTNNPDFTIKRPNTSMRIYPAATYTVTAEINVSTDFSGTITETIPARFNLVDSDHDYSVSLSGDKKIIKWTNVSLQPGEVKILHYTYDAPDVSPEFYLLGPITLKEGSVKTVFTEPRSWQIASDSACQSNVASGNWNTSGSWTNCASTTPQTGDTVQIRNGHTITFNPASATIDSLTIDNGGTFFASFHGGTLTLTSTGGSPLTINGTFTPGSTTTAFTGNNGAGNTTIPAATYNNLTLNNSSETFDLTGSITVNNNFTLTAGTISAGSSTVAFTGDQPTASVGTSTFNNLTLNMQGGTRNLTITGTMTVSGTLRLQDGGVTGGINAQGDIIQESTYDGSSSTITINGTGTQTLTGNATSSAGDLQAITINKISGTLNLAGTLRTTRNWTYTAGTTSEGTSTIYLVADQQTFTLGTGMAFNNVTVNMSGGTVTTTLSGTMNVNGTLTLTNGTINGGTLNAKGDIVQASTADSGTTTMLINGTGTQTFTGNATQTAGTLPTSFTINKSSGTLYLTGTIRTNGNWTYTAGAIDPGTSTVVFASQNTSKTITGSHTLSNVIFDSNSSSFFLIFIESATTLTVNGTLTFDNSSTGQYGVRGGNISAKGDVIIADAVNYDDSTIITMNGTEDQTLSGKATQTSGAFPSLVINKPSGTLYLAGTIRTGRDWTLTAGTIDPGTSTVVFVSAGTSRTITGTQTLYNVTFDSNTSSYFIIVIASGTTLNVNGTLKLSNSSTGQYGIRTGTIAAKGDIITNARNYEDSGSLVVNGTGNQTWTGSATQTSGSLVNVTINKPSGTLYLNGTIRTGKNWTYTAGTINAGTSTVVWPGSTATQTITGSHTLYNVIFDPNYQFSGMILSIAGGTTITTTGTLTFYDSTGLNGWGMTVNGGTFAVKGNLNIADNNTFAGTATLLINGTGNQTFTGNATDTTGIIPKVTIDKAAGMLNLSGTIRTDKDWTYAQGTINPGNSTVIFVSTSSPITITGSHTLNNVKFYPNTPYGGTSYTITSGTVLTTTGTLSLYNGQTNPYGIAINTGIIEAKGDVISDVGPFSGTATLKITGTGNQTWTGSATSSNGSLPIVEINKPSGTLILAGTIRTDRNWIYTTGSVDATTNDSLVILAGTMTLDGQGTLTTMAFDNLTLATTSGTVTLAGNLDIDGNYVNGTSTSSGLAAGSYNISVAGDWTDTATSTSAITTAGTVTFDGSGNSSINTGGTNTGHDFQNFVVAKTGSGVASLTGNTLDIDGSLTITSGIFSLNGQNVTTTTTFANNGTLRLQGAETISWTTNDTDSGSYEYVGDGDGAGDTFTLKQFTGDDYYSLKINSTDTGGTADTFNFPAALVANGDVTISSGTLDTVSGSNYALTVGGSWTNNGGTFQAQNGTVTFNAGSGGKTITTNGNWFYTVVINNASGGWTLQDNTTIANTLIITAGALNGGSSTLTLSGTTGTPLSIAGSFSGGTGTVNFSGNNSGGNTTIPALTTYNNLTVTNASETYVLAGTTALNGDLTITSGTLDVVSGQNYPLTIGGNYTNSGTFQARNGTVTFNAGSTGKTLTTNGNWFYNLVFNNSSGSWTLQDSTTIANALSVTAGNFSAGSTTLSLAGSTGTPFSLSGTFTPSSSTVVYSGNNSGGDTAVAATTYNNLTINNASETFVLTGTTSTTSNLTITAGTLDTVAGQNYSLNIGGNYANSGTLTARNSTTTFTATSGSKTLSGTLNGSSAFYNLTFNGNGGSWGINATTLVSNDLTLTAGIVSGTNNITVNGGDVTGSGALNLTAGTLLIDGTGSYGGGNWSVYNLTFGDGSGSTTTTAISGTSTIAGLLTIATNQTLNGGPHTFSLTGTSGTPLIINGAFSPATSTIAFAGDNGSGNTNVPSITYANLALNHAAETFVLTGPTTITYDLTITAGTLDTVSGQNYPLSVGRNWSNSGTFTARSGTVTLITSADATISGTTLFNNLTTTIAGKRIKFQKASAGIPVFTIAGTLTTTGTANNKVVIQSDTPGSQWLVHFNTAQSAVTYTNIQDAGCDAGTSTVTLNQTSFDAGNNSACWSFSGTQSPIRVNGGTRLNRGSRLQGI